jgi:hypothetical protein
MAKRLPEPPPPRTTTEPIEPTGEVARKNIVLALALVGVAILLAGGAVLVSFIYLLYD